MVTFGATTAVAADPHAADTQPAPGVGGVPSPTGDTDTKFVMLLTDVGIVIVNVNT